MTARRLRKTGRPTPPTPKRSRVRTPEDIAHVATTHDAPAGPTGDKVKVVLTLALSRAQAEHLTARAIREGKNLEALVAEILEGVPASGERA